MWNYEALREKCSNTEFFLVRIFLHSDWIQRDTPCFSVFSSNAGKYEPEKTPYLDTFLTVKVQVRSSRFAIIFKVGVLNNLATFAGKHLCFQVCNFRPSILLKRDSNTGVFLWILRIFWERVFYRTPLLATSNRCKLFLAF